MLGFIVEGVVCLAAYASKRTTGSAMWNRFALVWYTKLWLAFISWWACFNTDISIKKCTIFTVRTSYLVIDHWTSNAKLWTLNTFIIDFIEPCRAASNALALMENILINTTQTSIRPCTCLTWLSTFLTNHWFVIWVQVYAFLLALLLFKVVGRELTC